MADAKEKAKPKPPQPKAGKPLRTPGKDWRSKPSDGSATAASAGDADAGAGAGAAAEKRYKFRNEEKPRGEACYVCSKDGHRADECELVAGLQKRFNVFVQKQKNNEALTLKDHNSLLWDAARAMEKRGAVYVFDSITAQVFPKLKPNEDSYKAIEFIHSKAAKDKSAVEGLPVPTESPTLRIKAIVAARAFAAGQAAALGKVGELVEYIRSHGGECARAPNRFKLRKVLMKGTGLSQAVVDAAVSLMARGGVIAEKKKPKADAKDGDAKAAAADAKAADAAAGDKKPKKEGRATDAFVFDFSKVAALKELPAEDAKAAAKATSATTGAGRSNKAKNGGLTASQLKKQKIAAKKAKFEAEALADPAKAAARKAAADAKREQRKELRAKQRAAESAATNKAKQLAGTAVPKKQKKPAAAAATAAEGTAATAAADAKPAAAGGKKKRKAEAAPAAAGAATAATATAAAPATDSAAPSASKKRKSKAGADAASTK